MVQGPMVQRPEAVPPSTALGFEEARVRASAGGSSVGPEHLRLPESGCSARGHALRPNRGRPSPTNTDPESDPLTVTAFDATSAQGATVSVNADGSFAYDPTGAPALQALGGGASVVDTFGYTIDDGSSNPDAATVSVTVIGVNDVPRHHRRERPRVHGHHESGRRRLSHTPRRSHG